MEVVLLLMVVVPKYYTSSIIKTVLSTSCGTNKGKFRQTTGYPQRNLLSLSGVGIDDRCGLPQLLQLQSGGYADTDLRDCQQSLESNPAETGKNAEREEAAGGAEGTRTVSDMFEPQIC